ncbi:MAG TPA: YggT family protein [Oleiagrimonas sp.]|nr:YggT family protein [Oleiagrimonas sp.]
MSYLANALELLIQFAFDALLALFLLRLFAELWRAHFHNPLSQFIYRYSNPVLAPLRRHIPNWHRWNMAALLVAYVLELLKWLALFGIYGSMPHIGGLLVLGLGSLLSFVMVMYVVLIFVWALASMLSAGSSTHSPHPVLQFVEQLVAPAVRPLSQRLPTLGGIDFSPAVAILILMLARILIAEPLLAAGMRLAL